MATSTDPGIVFPADAEGRRSTSALGQQVVRDALADVDPVGAAAAEHETSWRSGYLAHFRRLTVAGLASRADATTIARQGLASLHEHMRVIDEEGDEQSFDVLQKLEPRATPGTRTISGTAEPLREAVLPHRGRLLRGAEIHRTLDDWVDRGIIEPGCAVKAGAVVDNPDWLRLEGQTVVVLGAGAEMGPTDPLLRWGATVAGIDLPSADVTDRLARTAEQHAGTLLLPEVDGEAGLDLIAAAPAAARWVEHLDDRLVLGNYAYADGAKHVLVSMAVDALITRLASRRDDIMPAMLATPTDVFGVPGTVVARSARAYADRSMLAKLLTRPLRAISGGRLMRRAYARGVDPGVCDALVRQQGPNYALAKRLQRWRATDLRDAGRPFSFHVAPATRTRSVVKNRALAAAYAGAHRFGVEIFDPSTTNTLMAMLLVHDAVNGPPPAADQVWQDEADAAAHGGLWTTAWAPPSVLGLAALLGVGSAR